ncbi:MAG: tRNA uridine-5-carboxymethylaminomethyl(34) synthesis GTPase MnmE [Bdellovibrio bacteriovorus]
MATETIAAVATPRGIGGVGIVRVSGPLARTTAEAILGRVPRPRHATFASFHSADGSSLDEGIALLFPAPRSFTGEDVLELQGHGGPLVLDLVLQRCLELGARLARPGEFSERAFLNGKLDLTQAEAVADLIESSTALGARLAMRSLQGVFSRRVTALTEGLIHLRTYLEATLDFPDDELDLQVEPAVAGDLDDLIAQTRELLAEAHQGERIRDGFTIAIAGPPNAGKSSLLNALSRADTAIVTPIPGTTRDLLRVDVQVDGLPVRLVDTAGLRASQDPVEREGVRRARDQIARSDLVLWVYDATQGLDPSERSDIPPGVPLTLIRNKVDLLEEAGNRDGPEGDEIALSALTGAGLDRLRRHIRIRAGVESMGEGAFVARRRHLEALERGLAHLDMARRALQTGAGPELIALDLLVSQQAFGEITGVFTPDDLLGRIFASFCIGK